MEVHKDSAGNVWEFKIPSCKCEKDPNELVDVIISVPKLRPKQKKALDELRLKSDSFVSQLQKDVEKAIHDYEHELHQKNPEMTLAELGINTVLAFEEGNIKIKFK